MQDRFEVRRDTARRLLTFVTLGPCSANQIKNSGVVHPRVYLRYLTALADAGLITISRATPLMCPDGKTRKCTVVEAATRETARRMLGTNNATEEDRWLWEELEPLHASAAHRRHVKTVTERMERITHVA